MANMVLVQANALMKYLAYNLQISHSFNITSSQHTLVNLGAFPSCYVCLEEPWGTLIEDVRTITFAKMSPDPKKYYLPKLKLVHLKIFRQN